MLATTNRVTKACQKKYSRDTNQYRAVSKEPRSVLIPLLAKNKGRKNSPTYKQLTYCERQHHFSSRSMDGMDISAGARTNKQINLGLKVVVQAVFLGHNHPSHKRAKERMDA